MKLSHIGDIHIDDGPRLDECAKVLDIFIEESHKAKVDLIGFAGDLYHAHSVGKPATIREELFAVDFFRRCAEIAPVVGVRGNHDAAGDVDVFNYIQGQNPIWFAERPHVYAFRDFDVLTIPWYDRSHLAASLPSDLSSEEVARRTNETARQMLVVKRAEAAVTHSQGRIPIGLGHLTVVGATLSNGQNQSLMGTTVAVSPYDLHEIGCAYFGCSHFHLRQVWFDGAVAYAGSPMRHSLGEPENKGFNLVEIEKDGDGYKVRNDFVELPARRIELYEIDFTTEENLAQLKEHGINVCTGLAVRERTQDAMVRFRYHIRPEDMHLVDEKAIEKVLQADGAFSVKIDPQLVHTARVRSEAIVTAESTWDKLMAFWQSKNMAIPDDVAERLKVKLAQIESGETPAVTSKSY